MEQQKKPAKSSWQKSNEDSAISRVETFILTIDLPDELVISQESCYQSGKDAVKVTVQIDKSYAIADVIDSIKDAFQKTIRGFEQFL